MDEILDWVNEHKIQGHDATVTVAGAPGTGHGSYCHTCNTRGPNTFRILEPWEVK